MTKKGRLVIEEVRERERSQGNQDYRERPWLKTTEARERRGGEWLAVWFS